MENQGYEFTTEENRVIARTALWSSVLGGALCVQAMLKLVDFAENPIGTLVTIVISLIIGGSFLYGGASLRKVVDTEGLDIAHLMEALRQLTRAFTIRIVLVLIMVVLVGIVFLMFSAS